MTRTLRHDKIIPQHRSFKTIEEAANFALSKGASSDVYFTMHTLKQEREYNPNKRNFDGTRGGYSYRTHSNMCAARCFFSDVDVGESKPYRTQAEAILALKQFCAKVRLPKPTIVSSGGGGVHVYWPLETAIATEDWKSLALELRSLAGHHGFAIDPTRVDDQSSILRVPGTFHLKDPNNPKPVKILSEGQPVALGEFRRIITAATTFLPSAASAARALTGGAAIAFQGTDAPKPPSFKELGEACGIIRHLARHPAQTTEPAWYAGLGVVRFVEDGRAWAHKISAGYPGYTAEETDKKLDQLEQLTTADGRPYGPTTCAMLAEKSGLGERCAKCWYKGNPQSSPVVAARRLPKKAPAGIPDPPHPYSRLKEGGLMYAPLDGVPVVFCPYDLWPKSLSHNTIVNTRTSHWGAVLPHKGEITFEVPLALLGDLSELTTILLNNGIVLDYDAYKMVRNYMSMYIQQLQRHAAEIQQHGHLGWTAQFDQFILPDEIITANGPTPANLTDNATNAAMHVKRAGTLEKQIELLNFYNHPEYVRQQFLIMCGLAATTFYATGHHGVIVNATGEPGASKSTAMYTAAAMFGDPKLFAINGTNDGATIRARNELVSLLANLPICVDEITLMDRDAAKDLALSISQPQQRMRLERSGKLKPAPNAHKATIMISTSNASLHEMLSHHNQSGTAGSMRVIEVWCPRLAVHERYEADAFLAGIGENYGHIGPAFVKHFIKNRARIQGQIVAMKRTVDKMTHAIQAERFWSDSIANVVAVTREARVQGLVPFDPEAILQWATGSLVPSMRSAVTTNYASHVDVLMGYINSVVNDLVVVQRDVVTKNPARTLAGRFEVDQRRLFLAKAEFKNYCTRIGQSFNVMLDHLTTHKIAHEERVSLGKGSPHTALGRSAAISIDLRHELIAGRLDALEEQADTNVVPLRARDAG